MLKIFVTGDNHIGIEYKEHPRKDRLVAERIEAFTRMVDKANEEGCELFAITGDLFEDTEVDDNRVKAVVAELKRFNGPVAVLPGNHDYYTNTVSVWQTFLKELESDSQIKLLTDEKPYEYENFTIYPAVCHSHHSDDNALGWIKKYNFPDDGKIRIGMAHGTVEGEAPDEKKQYFYMTRDELRNIGVNAWLIGHTHVPFPRHLKENFERVREPIFNPGSHVQPDSATVTEGLCFILEFDEQGKVFAKKFVSGALRFYKKKLNVLGDLEKTLEKELKECIDNSVVELEVKGAVNEDDFKRRDAIIEQVLKRFLEAKPPVYGDLTILITEKKIDKNFPETSLYSKMLKELSPKSEKTDAELEQMTQDQKDEYLRELQTARKQTQMAFNLILGKEEKNNK